MNGYDLSRRWFDFAFENPDIIRPIHAAIYFFAIEHCNRLGWKEKFGLPSQMVMEAIGVKNWRTYSAGLKDLVDFGFIKMIETSKNQYSSNIIAIVNFTKADTKALDKALQKHGTKQGQSTVSIDKQINKEQGTKTFTPPTLFEVQKYFDEKGYSQTAANKAYEYYSTAGWKDSKGNKIKNWKQKMIGVWFRPENEKKKENPNPFARYGY